MENKNRDYNRMILRQFKLGRSRFDEDIKKRIGKFQDKYFDPNASFGNIELIDSFRNFDDGRQHRSSEIQRNPRRISKQKSIKIILDERKYKEVLDKILKMKMDRQKESLML